MSDKNVSAYDLDNTKLMDRFANVCAKSGASNSGLAIDIMGPARVSSEARYLKGVLLSRLEGLKPPFKEGDKVNIKKEYREKWIFKNKKVLNNLHVSYIHYNCDRKQWELQLKDFEEKIPAEYCCSM